MLTYFLVGMALAFGQTPGTPAATTPTTADAAPASWREQAGAPLPPISSRDTSSSSSMGVDAQPADAIRKEICPRASDSAPGQTGVFAMLTNWSEIPMPGLATGGDESPIISLTAPGLFVPPVVQGASSANPPAPPKPDRRELPSPFASPPFPGSEYQGYPLIGVPPDYTMWPLMREIQGTPFADLLNSERIRVYGWLTAEANASTSKNTNTPDSYWIRPNNIDVDQALIRVERNLDSVQTDHIDWGIRSTLIYGIDYRYTTAGGWFSDQLLKHNFLYGFDPTEQYFDVYVPWVAQGIIIRVGRWIACPDIETQFAPDNYMGSHSLLFTFDTYTQTGVMATVKLSDQWTVQGAIHAGTDMAPWYAGAIPTGAFGVRWVSQSNNDAFYTWLNAINDAKFRRFEVDGQPAGHDNFNYVVSTWEHRFDPELITKTEAYIMWQRDAVVGGTPSIGPVEPFGGGGGIGADIPGTTFTFGVLNFTLIQLSDRDYITVRNEWWKDTDGERSGFPSTYTSNAIGICHNFSPEIQIRPEIGYYRSWTVPAFDNGTRKNEFMAAFDFTVRF
jgi:hypothetical protein